MARHSDMLSSEDERYMKEKPSRYEVASYVNSLMEKHYLPLVTNYIQMSSMVIQAILLEKGICTGEEIKKMTEQFVAEQQKRIEEQQREQKEIENMENGLVGELYDLHKCISMEKWKFTDSKDKSDFELKLLKLINTLVAVNKKSEVTEEKLQEVLTDTESMKSKIDSGTSRFTSIKYNMDFSKAMEKAIESLNQAISAQDDHDGAVEIKPAPEKSKQIKPDNSEQDQSSPSDQSTTDQTDSTENGSEQDQSTTDQNKTDQVPEKSVESNPRSSCQIPHA